MRKRREIPEARVLNGNYDLYPSTARRDKNGKKRRYRTKRVRKEGI